MFITSVTMGIIAVMSLWACTAIFSIFSFSLS